MKPIGLVQRCLFSFRRQLPAPDPTWDPFWKEAFIPFLEHIFRFVLPSVGPKACEAEWFTDQPPASIGCLTPRQAAAPLPKRDVALSYIWLDQYNREIRRKPIKIQAIWNSGPDTVRWDAKIYCPSSMRARETLWLADGEIMDSPGWFSIGTSAEVLTPTTEFLGRQRSKHEFEQQQQSRQITNVQEQVGFELEELLKVLGAPRTVCNLAKGLRLYVLNAIAFFEVRSSCCFRRHPSINFPTGAPPWHHFYIQWCPCFCESSTSSAQ